MGGRGSASHRMTGGGSPFIRTFLQNAYGMKHSKAVTDILKDAPSYIRAMWDDFASQFRASNMSRDNGAFYSPEMTVSICTFRL